MSNVDQDLLLFVAAHELVLMEQAAGLLQLSHDETLKRLDGLRDQGLVSRVRLSGLSPSAYRITAEGADLVDSALPPLRPLEARRYRHDVAVAWVWGAVHNGWLGEVREVLSRREMQAADATLRTESLLDTAGATFNDEPPCDAGAGVALAYPDLGMVKPEGGWVSIELVLSVPDPERVRVLLGRYRCDRLLRGSLFLVEQDGQTRELIESAAAELGLANRVGVQWLAEDGIAGG